MRIVIDTNVLVRAHPRAQGPARRLLNHVTKSPSDVLILSSFILSELKRVLAYPRLARRYGLSSDEVAEYVRDLIIGSAIVMPQVVQPSPIRDVEDNPVLGTALAGAADVLCTLDRDFFDARTEHFCASKGIQLLTDVELIRVLNI